VFVCLFVRPPHPNKQTNKQSRDRAPEVALHHTGLNLKVTTSSKK